MNIDLSKLLPKEKFVERTYRSQFNPERFISFETKYKETDLWIGTDGNGLLKYKNGKFEKFTTDQGLADNVVWCIYEDVEENIWIGTGGGGISKYKDGKFTNLTQENGLSSNYIWSIYKDKSGSLWAGSDGGGLNRIKDGKVTIFSPSNGFPSEYSTRRTRP